MRRLTRDIFLHLRSRYALSAPVSGFRETHHSVAAWSTAGAASSASGSGLLTFNPVNNTAHLNMSDRVERYDCYSGQPYE